MKNLFLIATALFFAASIYAQTSQTKTPNSVPSVQASNLMTQANTFIFKENKGQLKDENGKLLPEIPYYSSRGGVHVYCKSGKINFVFTKIESENLTTGSTALSAGISPPVQCRRTIETSRMELLFLNSNASARIIASDQQEYYENFYTTGDADQGITHVRTYKTLTYYEIYPHIDLVLHTEGGGMEYSFIVHPGGRVGDIRMQWDGTVQTESLANGGFRYANSLGHIEESAPMSFCEGNPVGSSFKQEGNYYGFEIGSYDKTKDLLIDPILVWATYYGGSNYEFVADGATDTSGNVYFTGYTLSTSGIATTGAYQTTMAGVRDGYLAKFNSSGTRQWSTYFGGSDFDISNGVATDISGKVYITGYTGSSSGIATTGADQTSFAGGTYDAYLLKFNASGTRQWSTYFGGSGYDVGNDIATDTFGNVYITGQTLSTSGIVISGAYQTSNAGTSDAFLAKFDTSGTRKWATYFGGSAYDYGIGIVSGSGNVYITGNTTSTSGIATFGAHQTSIASSGGGIDAFLAKFDTSGTRQWATYYGGTDEEQGLGVTTDDSSNVYITGYTLSTSGIATTGSYQTSIASTGTSDAFLVKFNTAGTRQWATYYGGEKNDQGISVATDAAGNVYFSGTTYSTYGIGTTGAYQTSNGGNSDAYLTKFSSAGSRYWATYYGGSGYEYCYGVATDDSGNVYITGNTGSTSGIATTGAYQTSSAGSDDAFLVKFHFFSHDAGIVSLQSPKSSFCTGTQDVNVKLHNFGTQDLLKSVRIEWAVNGKAQTAYNWTGKILPGANDNVTIGKFNFPPGSYTLSAWTTKPNSVTDSVPQNDTLRTLVNAVALPTANAGSNKSICKGGSTGIGVSSQSGITYSWTSWPTGFTSITSTPTVSPDSTTTYYLTVIKTATGCSKSDTVVVTVNSLPAGDAGSDQTICKGESASIGNSAVSGNTYSWTSVPAGFTSASANPSVSPNTTTVYYLTETITVTSCIKSDSIKITVNPLPAANAGSDQTICYGVSASIGDSAVSGNTYSWTSVPAGFTSASANPLVSPTQTTVYYITETITATGCSRSDSVSVTVNPLPDNTITLSGTTLSANQNGGTYQWLDCNTGNSPIPGATNQSYTAAKNGDYAVAVTLNGCSDTSACVNVNTIGIGDKAEKNNRIIIYPNPNNGSFTIEFDGLNSSKAIKIFDVAGKLIQERKTENKGLEINLPGIAKGVYFLHVYGETEVYSGKIVIH